MIFMLKKFIFLHDFIDYTKYQLKNIKTSFSKIAKKKMRLEGGSHYKPKLSKLAVSRMP